MFQNQLSLRKPIIVNSQTKFEKKVETLDIRQA